MCVVHSVYVLDEIGVGRKNGIKLNKTIIHARTPQTYVGPHEPKLLHTIFECDEKKRWEKNMGLSLGHAHT